MGLGGVPCGEGPPAWGWAPHGRRRASPHPLPLWPRAGSPAQRDALAPPFSRAGAGAAGASAGLVMERGGRIDVALWSGRVPFVQHRRTAGRRRRRVAGRLRGESWR